MDLQHTLNAAHAHAGTPDVRHQVEVRVQRHADPARWQAHVRVPQGAWLALHSARDPLAEARAQLAPVAKAVAAGTSLVIVGCGLGYILEAALEDLPAARVLGIEVHPELLTATHDRVPRLTGEASLRLVSAADGEAMRELWRLFDDDTDLEPAVLVHPVLARVPSLDIDAIVAAVRKAAFSGRANARARREHGGRYLLNTLRNRHALAASADVADLFDQFTNTPAVIVAAGPSLDDNIGELAGLAQRVLLVSVDTALRPLLARGIAPHLVVAIDPSELNARHLMHLPASPGTVLAAEPSVDPRILEAFAGRLAAFRVGTHHPWPWLQAQGLDRAPLDVWGSVLTAAFDLVLRAGCGPIAFAGADLAYTSGRTYCRGAVWEEDWARQAGSGGTLEEIWLADVRRRETVRATDLHGDEIETASHLVSFRDWLVDRAARSGRVIVNATGAGILHGEGIRQQALSAFAREHATSTHVPSLSLGQRNERAGDAAAEPDIADWHRTTGVPVAELHAALASAPADKTFATIGRDLRDLPERTVDLREALSRGVPSPSTAPSEALPRAVDAARRLLRLDPPIVDCRLGTPAPARPVWTQFLWADHAADEAFRFHELSAAVARSARREPLPHDCYLAGPPRSGQANDSMDGDLAARLLIALQAAWLDDDPTSDPARHLRMRVVARAVAAATRGAVGAAARDEHGLRMSPRDAIVAMTGVVSWEPFVRDAAGDLAQAVLNALSDVLSGSPWERDVLRHRMEVDAPFIAPVPLTGTALPRCYCGYIQDGRRAVFASAGLPHAFYISHDGRIEQGRSWPGPISGEIPWGRDGGALAWHAYPPYRVMLRESAAAAVVVHDLPFAAFRVLVEPDGSTLWASYDGGLWAWDLHRGARLVADTPPVIGIHRAGTGVQLDPVLRGADGGFVYERPPSALSWDPEAGRLGPLPFGVEGPCWSESTAHGWTARVFDLSDQIAMIHREGTRLWLACETPTSVAWAGRSLIVNTRVGDVLLFPLLADRLEEWALTGGAPTCMETR